MRLLNSQEIAVEKARKKHEFERLYNNLSERIDKHVSDSKNLLKDMQDAQNQLLAYIKTL